MYRRIQLSQPQQQQIPIKESQRTPLFEFRSIVTRRDAEPMLAQPKTQRPAQRSTILRLPLGDYLYRNDTGAADSGVLVTR